MRVLLVALDLASLAGLGLVVSAVATRSLGVPQSDIAWFQQIADFGSSSLQLLSAATLFAFAAKFISTIIVTRKTQFFLAGLEVKYSQVIARQIFRANLNQLDEFSQAELQWLILRSPQILFTQLLGQLMTFLGDILLAAVLITSVALITPVPTVILTSYLICVLVILQIFIRPRMRKSGRRLRNSTVEMTNHLRNLVEAFREIFAGNRSTAFVEALIDAKKRNAWAQAHFVALNTIPRPFFELSLVIGLLLGLNVFTLMESSVPGNLEIGVLVASALRLLGLFLPIQKTFATLQFLQAQAMDASVALKTATQPLSTENALISDSTILEGDSDRLAPTITFQNVEFSHPGSNSRAIKSASFRIVPGSFLIIKGPSGAGKTTLVDLMVGLREPTGGVVMVDGLSPQRFLRSHPGQIGFVPQRPGILPGSVFFNVSLGQGVTPETELRCKEALRRAHLLEVVEQLPLGIHSDLGKHGASLSGGQSQRLGLARALYSSPNLLILDEPTSAADGVLEEAVAMTLKELNGEGITIVLIAHSDFAAPFATSVLSITQGSVQHG